jgi:hypothetical protein
MKHPRDFNVITQGEMTMPGVVNGSVRSCGCLRNDMYKALR